MSEVQNTTPKAGFSWLGFLFAPAYYAGYGKFQKGLLLGFLGGFPFVGFGVAGYGGFQAKKELPIKQQPFDWGKAITTLILQIICGTLITVGMSSFQQPSAAEQQQEILESVSGVWSDGRGGVMAINLQAEKPHLIVQGLSMATTVAKIDLKQQIIALKVNMAGYGNFIWTLRKVVNAEEDSFTLLFTDQSGNQQQLSFVRNL